MSSNNLGQQAAPQIQTVPVQKSKTGKYLLFGTLGCFLLITISCVGFVVIAALASDPSKTNNSSQTVTVAPTESKKEVALTDEQISKYATSYCEKRKPYKLTQFPFLKLKDAMKPFSYDNVENSTPKTGDKLTTEDCRNSVQFLYEYYKEQGDSQALLEEKVGKIVEGKFWTDIESAIFVFSVGFPDKKNVTYDNGTYKEEQYIYGDGLSSTNYFYFTNGKLTSKQQF